MLFKSASSIFFTLFILLLFNAAGCKKDLSDDVKEQESAVKQTTIEGTDTIKILWREDVYSEQYKMDISTIKLNAEYINSSPKWIKAVIAYYSTKSGTECDWENGYPNSTYSNLRCLLTDALGLEYQGGEKQKEFISKWFAGEEQIQQELNDVYSIPYTATIQETFDYISLIHEGNKVTVVYAISGVNLREDRTWKQSGQDIFENQGSSIKVISRMQK